MPTLIVKGKVVTVDGEPLERKIVEVRPRLSAAVYGTAATTLTDGGNYMATLSTTTAGSGSTFDVEVVVCELDNTEIGRSVLLYDVAGEITVDIVVGAADYRGRSDFRRIEARIDPLRGSLAVDELGSEHIEYLSAKLDMDPLRIAQYIQAHRMSVLLDTVPAWAFYALLRQGLPAEVPQLLAQGRPVHEGGLAAAIAGNVIADPGEPTLNAVLDELQAQAAESAVWAHPTDPDAKSKFRRLLDTAAGPEASYTVQLAFMEKHLAHTGTLAEFWDAVDADIDLGPTVRATYEWTLQINTLANEHMPLITALQAKRADIGDPIKSFRDLSALDVADWVDLLSSGIGAPASIPLDWPEEDRILRYAETIERIVTDTYPTTVIHRRIVRDHTASPGSIAGAPDLIQFFDDNPAFELSPHELDAYLADHPTALDNVTDAAATRANLKKLQRLARLAPRGFQYRVLKPLYQAGLHSALQIGRMTEKSFVRKYGTNLGGDDIARSVYQRARMSAGIALMVATQFARGFNKTPISVVPSSTLPDYEGHPDLEALFGNLDFCACDHCRSVYSATAYFVDLLQFLKDQPGKDAGSNALDALMERRPELTAIELSCINTNTEVPYIDLVNELLEYHVSRHANAPLAVSSSFWQTTWTAEELAVRPEHQLSQAYNVALDTPYPFGLPFDLAFAETSLYHQSFDVSRERMENAYPHNDPDYADRRARARLGLDLMSWYVIINSGLISWSPRAFWGGETADEPQPPDWWTPLRTVSTFLKRAEIDISELAALLRTRFIGRAGLSISYAAPPDDCNLDEAEILTLGEADLGKIHRFIRLQRKIGWTADELDLALRTLSGDPPALDGASVR
ncbi:MAG TPA: Tc toxin subunit A, partial [Nannocystis sp.]